MSKIFTRPHRPIYDGGSPHDYTGDNKLGLYTEETTQRYVHGTRHITWDGRVFKYALAGGELESYHGCRASEAALMSYTAMGVAASAGDLAVSITKTGRVEDDLAGGYAVLYDGGDIDTTNMRGIVGNDASGATYTKIYLDYPLHLPLVVTTDAHEVYENPYGAIYESTDGYSAWVGVPCVSCAAAKNLWIQTWGPCLVSGGETVDTPSSDARTLVWGSNAALFKTATKTSGQIAGYILNQGSSSIAGPLIQLMCST